MSQEEDLNKLITDELLKLVKTVVTRELEAKIPEIKEQIISELREEIEVLKQNKNLQ